MAKRKINLGKPGDKVHLMLTMTRRDRKRFKNYCLKEGMTMNDYLREHIAGIIYG